jgi:hypothetical protein
LGGGTGGVVWYLTVAMVLVASAYGSSEHIKDGSAAVNSRVQHFVFACVVFISGSLDQ